MNIVIVNNSVIPALLYGGTERVIWYLGKELVAMGHKVTYLVREGSYCPFANIVPLNPQKSLAEQIPESADVVHFNSVADRHCPKPYIVTIHGNGRMEDIDTCSVFVSKDHAMRNGSDSYVYNGLDWNDYGKVNLNAPRSYYHFLGKAAWRVKNIRGAIDIIHRVKNEKLYVLGGYRFNFKMGVRLTFSPRIKFFGMVGGEEKNRLLSGSKGLIFPVRWHEPFGLALTESLYFGAPIYGTPYGSLKEIVTSDVGFLSDNSTDIALRIKEGGFDPKRCHEYACDNFGSRKMAESYLKKYETVLAGQPLSIVKPIQQEYQNDFLKFDFS